MTTPATKASAAPTHVPFSFGSTSQPMPATALQTNIPASGAGFSFGVTPVGGTTTPMASVSPTPAPLSFGCTPQPMPITASQTNVPASSSAGVSLSFGAGAASTAPAFGATVSQLATTGFSFGASAQPAVFATPQSSTFFGASHTAGGDPLVVAAPNFGVAPTNTFNLGGGTSSSGVGAGGASARRRAAKSSGRKK